MPIQRINMLPSKKTILIVDDTESNIDMLLAILKEYDTVVATNGEDALNILEEEAIDLVLLDIVMSGIDGFEVCRRMKNNPNTHKIPVVFITAKSDEDTIEEAYSIGGIDYVTKPFKPRELRARVKTHLEFQSMVQHLDFIASYDMLTGILNRRKFFTLSQELFETHDNVCAIMIDIDRFKHINDSFGHHGGDIALKSIAQSIAHNLSNEAIFGRLGGEEFSILLTNVEERSVMELVEKIREAIENSEITLDDATRVHCTISSGIAMKDAMTKTLDMLLQKADNAMYEAKEKGRNRSIFRA